ncbi:hypothetical protein JCM8547_002970 [Rhodosporidiobolus lusitaniae]
MNPSHARTRSPEPPPGSSSSSPATLLKKARLDGGNGKDVVAGSPASQSVSSAAPAAVSSGGRAGGKSGSSISVQQVRDYGQMGEAYARSQQELREVRAELAEAIKQKEAAERRAERLEFEISRLRQERLVDKEENRTAMDEVVKRLSALEARQNGLGANETARGSTASLSPSSTFPSTDFPSLQDSANATPRPSPALPRQPVSYASIASRFPSISKEHSSLFSRLKPSLPATFLPNNGSDLTHNVVRLYFNSVEKKQGAFRRLKDAFHACQIPDRAITHLAFINIRETAVTTGLSWR